MPTASTSTSAPAPPTNHAKATRRKPLVSARRGRRHHDEEDDEAGTEESYSDDSELSADEEEEAYGSEEYSEDEFDDEDEQGGGGMKKKVEVGKGEAEVVVPVTDTEIMKRSVKAVVGTGGDGEGVEFEDMGTEKEGVRKVELLIRPKKEEVVDKDEAEAGVEDGEEGEGEEGRLKEPEESQQGGKSFETPFEKRRREHEEYKKRRAEDPAFVPNRGRFFMHDHRDNSAGSNGFRPFVPGRNRGPNREPQPPPPELAADHWAHDLHEEVAAEPPRHQNQGPAYGPNRHRVPDQPRSFGRVVHKGTVQIQVKLPDMKDPITFSEVPWKAYTRLPYHRPPLRRDKPVRVALPDAPVRYIYPAVARSFIFIPRAMRPGGSGYIRGGGHVRGRGGLGGSFGGGFAAGRSMYGGSTVYSPSIGMSRRSSVNYGTRQHTPSQSFHAPAGVPYPAAPAIASGVVAEDHQTRPVDSTASEDPSKPIVRLPTTAVANATGPPPDAPLGPRSTTTTTSQAPNPATRNPHQVLPIPHREQRATPKIPMYQPRPTKNINISEIDSPAHVLSFPPSYPGYDPNSIPPTVTGTPIMAPPGPQSNGYAPHHERHASYQSQPPAPAAGLSPEMQRQQQQQQQQQMTYSYPPHPQQAGPYYPGPPHGGMYMVPPPPNPAAPGFAPGAMPPPQQPNPYEQPPTGPQTIAQESNGMVFYTTVPAPIPMQHAPPQQGWDGAYYGQYGMPGMMEGYYYPPPPPPQGGQGQQGQGGMVVGGYYG